MSQKPPTQTPEQHTDAAVHAPPVATHGVLHVCVVGSHTPWQQSASAVQAAFCAWHVPGGNPQRGGSTD